ncbi:MAG: MATE family efflux transporter [Kofleriaceae bacterium]|nr:MATE family efflux transporter [Kofleriaceae bacterium]
MKLAGPIIGLNVLNVLMLLVDSALCGRMPNSQDALEALGFAIQVIFLLMVAMLGLIVGTVALVARAYGGGDTKRLNHLLVQSTMMTVIVGVVVGGIGALAAEPILRVLGASPAVADLGADYLRPMMIGTPFFYLTLLYAGILRGVGNTRIPFLIALGTNVVNAVLNYGLILGNLGMPALGVTGSAIGTVIAQFLNMVTLVIVLRSGAIPNLKLPLAPKKIDHALAGELYRIGWPAAIDMLILNAGFMTALGILGRIDGVSVAAHGLGLRVQSVAFVPGLGIAQATSAMVGQALGGGSVDRARQVARASMILSTAIMTVLAILIVLTDDLLVQIFDVKAGTPLESYTLEWMMILGLAMLPAGTNMALIGLLQGSGATRISLRINFWSTLAIQVPLSWLLAFPCGLGATGVWLSFPIAFAAKAVIGYVAYRQAKWAVTGVRIPNRAPVVSVEH